ncbi:MAG: hypothetical protein M1820_004733 [Bogoriella megaspora]|nr:MAG: hypothetical protein M1820_004733 [Bogoriella megaspora]
MSEVAASSKPAPRVQKDGTGEVEDQGRPAFTTSSYAPPISQQLHTPAVSSNRHAFHENAAVSGAADTTGGFTIHPPALGRISYSPTGLHLQTSPDSMTTSEQPLDPNIPTPPTRNTHEVVGAHTGTQKPPLCSNLSLASMASMASSLSPRSALSSPALGALADITPLPSPLMVGESPGLWGRLPRSRAGSGARPPSQGSIEARLGAPLIPRDELVEANGLKSPPSRSPSKNKKPYGLLPSAVEARSNNEHAVKRNSSLKGHGRNRSISEFVPEALHNARARNVTVSATHPPIFTDGTPPNEPTLHREKYLAEERGLHSATDPGAAAMLPSPPPSNKSATEEDDDDEWPAREDNVEYLTVRCGKDHVKKLFRSIRVLGQGTFSRVVLATGQKLRPGFLPDESHLNPRQLVAIKIVQHGPAGGADEERVETSLKREIEIMKSISHPSLVHLKAYDQDERRALLVLTYCPGSDLFNLASENRGLISPSLIQRMFSELVSAVLYLHENYIVHRDIKLENVLVNVPQPTLPTINSYQTYPNPIITLTDLGLSRRIPSPPMSPLLTTRCGSEDYAAPEILLGQPYDGRATDAWALGVLLYALMEGRLPFDPIPGARPTRASHRIARADWVWCAWGDEDGGWDSGKKGAQEFEGAREVVEGVLKKVRMGRKSVAELAEMPWVKNGVQVEGGLKMPENDDVEILRADTL